MQKKTKNIIVAVTLAVIVTVPACGYHLSGTGGIVPQGEKTLAVPVIFNATYDPYEDVELTQAVVEEFSPMAG
jgi:outer membrane lipopolysaccharide assembly protein LptE/RlpB